MSQATSIDEYDGFFFSPYEDETTLGVNFRFFQHDEKTKGVEIHPPNILGKTWHVILFKSISEKKLSYDDSFEAILGDPEMYATNLSKCMLFGCIVKKTTQSETFVKDYIKNMHDIIDQVNEEE